MSALTRAQLNKRTQERISRVQKAVREGFGVHNAVALALKEQDRDTRHACAEAVLSNDTDRAMAPDVLTRAHQACMTAYAV